MSKTSRTIRRNISQRQLQKGYEIIGKQLSVLNRHEHMLNALDKYIEQLELLLVAKGIFTQGEVEAAADRATAQPIPEQPLKEETNVSLPEVTQT